MSRTYKDAPKRVRAARSGVTTHRHALFGRTVYRSVPLYNEAGDRVWRSSTYTTVEDREVVTVERSVPAYRRVVDHVYADHCTSGIEEPDPTRTGVQSLLPCYPAPVDEPYRSLGRSSRKEARRFLEKRTRQHARRILRQYTRQQAWTEMDDTHAPWQQHRHNMWWWD